MIRARRKAMLSGEKSGSWGGVGVSIGADLRTEEYAELTTHGPFFFFCFSSLSLAEEVDLKRTNASFRTRN